MIDLYSLISSSRAAASSMIFWRSRAASCLSCMFKIARACSSSIFSIVIRPSLASSAVALLRIRAMTLSSASRALRYPRRMCARSSAFLSLKLVLLTITFTWCSTQLEIKPSRESVLGTPSTSANMLAEKFSRSWVYLYKLFRTTLATASFFKTTTSR
ncbi:unannotated protein [freshwater metagenome]|uniref:Unannotated protein n=1 Tax=freshwater metagenome TaxID=449393 RepID=A0A6J7FZB8_9ZZZZ